MKKKPYFLLFLLFSLNLALSACLSRVDKHGYMFELSDHALLQEGVFSKSKVLQIMGSPTIVSDFSGQEVWIYYGEDVRKLLFFKPDVISRDILLLSFDQHEILSKLENYSLQDENKVKFASNYTEVKSNKKGFFKSIFSNIGSVKPQ